VRQRKAGQLHITAHATLLLSLLQAVYNRATPHILSQLLVSWHMHAQPGQQQQQLRAPKLQLAPLQRCPCETFGQLFEWLLLQHGQLCWGLHRQAVHDGRLLEYVYTSPHTVSTSCGREGERCTPKGVALQCWQLAANCMHHTRARTSCPAGHAAAPQ
jgi:hypothetical protein